MRILRLLCVLCLAPLAGVSCGDPSLSAGIERPPAASTSAPVYYFAPMKAILLSDRGPRCATVWVGGVVVMRGCSDFSHLPNLVLSDANNGLIMLMVDPGDVISFPAGVKVLTTSKHYVVAQMSANMYVWDLRFTVTSVGGVRRCGVDRIGFMYCR